MPIGSAQNWSDFNMQRVYPLADDALSVSRSGVSLPYSFLVDMQILIPVMSDADATEKFYISAIDRTTDSFRLEISYQADANTSILCARSGDIPATLMNTDDMSQRTIPLSAVGGIAEPYEGLNDFYGMVLIGTCLDMPDIGRLTFDYGATKIISARVMAYDTGIRSVAVRSTADNEEYVLTQDFAIQAGDGIGLSVDTSGDMPVVMIYRIPDESSAYQFRTPQDAANALRDALGMPIRMVNGIPPDATGNLSVAGGDCLSVQSSTNGIEIANPCAMPCCTDENATDVSDNMDMLEASQARIADSIATLTKNITEMQTRLASLIASR